MKPGTMFLLFRAVGHFGRLFFWEDFESVCLPGAVAQMGLHDNSVGEFKIEKSLLSTVRCESGSPG
ncbi:hypothetical protein [Candidatus Methylacidithermus pantelleriae]|uniref:hypothetical protein n=1 Tax=Candidatus Methylacidithermus pantelleriae TaxID=2744239 RepID=UPI00157C2931|nr:hypothetical protein [Candidatus Methylacidithermus pantelleriae]